MYMNKANDLLKTPHLHQSILYAVFARTLRVCMNMVNGHIRTSSSATFDFDWAYLCKRLA